MDQPMMAPQAPAQPPVMAQPEPTQKRHGAANFFFYFLTFVLLYIVAFSLGGVLWQIINKSLPQVGQYYRGQFNAGSLRYNLAALIIGTPIFLWLAHKVFKDEQQNEAMQQSGIRRWLTYLTLIVTALLVIGDLIYLVYNLLGGETTPRIILKALVVLIIAAAVFYYYLQDVKMMRKGMGTGAAQSMLPRFYFIGSIIAVVATIVTGFFFIESPFTQRLRSQDAARLSNLQEIKNAVDTYASTNRALPANLAALKMRQGIDADPITKKPYDYQLVNESQYKLCAVFETSNRDAAANDQYAYPPDNGWLHDKGQTCFDETSYYLSNGQKGVPIDFPTSFQGFSQ